MKDNISKQSRLALIALAISAFAIGTTEFVIVGILPTIAEQLSISVTKAGWLITSYALGIAIGAPIVTAKLSHWSRKQTLLLIMGIFIIGNVLGSMAASFTLLVVARVITAVAHGVFFSLGATVATELVPKHKQGNAMSMMFSGLTIATIIGVPLGTFIGQTFGWRYTFIGVAILGMISFAATLISVPSSIGKGNKTSLQQLVKLIITPRILLALLMTAFGFGGTFVLFTYLSPLLQNVSGFPEQAVSILLLAYGIAVAIGNIIGGTIANQHPVKGLRYVFAAQTVVLFLLYWTSPLQVLGVVNIVLLGLLAFMMTPGVQVYIVSLAEKLVPSAKDVASALNISAFNVGIASGSAIGGIVVNHLELRDTAWVGALMVVGAIILAIINYQLDKKQQLF
ncbi:MFS transporter [Pontibacillus salicampi]|uniref:MFS transporter n=1 Tax=Pontibacillus salicampi TaxID=1449801 RepID=A0ABV6LQB4_9BACI